MFNGSELLERFLAHVRTLKSIKFVATNPFACESWFKVEMAPVLVDMGIAQARITPKFTYPGTRGKADLAIVAADESRTQVVFEFKHFVQFADAKKRQSLPGQIARLTELVHQGVIDQGVTFMVFGYLDSSQPAKIISRSFHDRQKWVVADPQPLLAGFPVVTVAVATIPG